MARSLPVETSTPVVEETSEQKLYKRFDLSQRIEHMVFITSFTILGITGLAQKFAENPISLGVMYLFGGVEGTRTIHHVSAFIMMWVSIYHVLAVLYKVYVLRTPLTMMPLVDDVKHVIQDFKYYLGLSDQRAYTGRYNYAEKAEYLAVVWGTVIMAVTGFMMWNPITTTKYLPGEIIPAAKAAHGAEALLAVLAIILWHMYHVHIKRFNRSMFTGYLTRQEMEEEHPAELDEIERGTGWKRPPEPVVRQRERIYYPVAAALFIVMSVAVVRFVTIEESAITTLPQAEQVAVFVPVTPTPRPTAEPTATPELPAGVGANTWEGNYSALFRNRCGTCHVRTALGGLSMATYQAALQGGENGPGIVPGEPDDSQIVLVQSTGDHPGQLTIDELQQVIDWIQAGAAER
jgi:cytochrome b subunit of formate dehydrogenase